MTDPTPASDPRFEVFVSTLTRIAALTAELAQARDETQQLRERKAMVSDALRAATERAQAAEQDARRYRFWRDWALADYGEERLVDDLALSLDKAETSQEFDAAIDAALASQGKEPAP